MSVELAVSCEADLNEDKYRQIDLGPEQYPLTAISASLIWCSLTPKAHEDHELLVVTQL